MNQGFSFIELLATLIILGILSSIAYPSYCHYLTRHHRLDAKTALFDLASSLEVYHMNHRTYAHHPSPLLSPAGFYKLEIISADENTYTLQATPIKTQAQADPMCQSFTLNHAGAEGIAEGPYGKPTGEAQSCWS